MHMPKKSLIEVSMDGDSLHLQSKKGILGIESQATICLGPEIRDRKWVNANCKQIAIALALEEEFCDFSETIINEVRFSRTEIVIRLNRKFTWSVELIKRVEQTLISLLSIKIKFIEIMEMSVNFLFPNPDAYGRFINFHQ